MSWRKALTPQPGYAADPKAALNVVADGDTQIDPAKSGAAYAEQVLQGLSPEQRAKKTLELIQCELDDNKAEDIVSIDLSGKSDIADTMIIASGRSQRHVGAMADKILRRLKEAGHGRVKAEGMPACDWVLLDAEDVIVHLFRPEVREFYNLERIWSEAAHAPIKSDA